ncbi:NAD(P)/FAD-dependent oxidoreductase [Halopseudomonas salegens]|uniref:Dehydrogenase (Flavoprotein) n=1 Tax=Halopseudomonas salegens TaxID=1434072 RepID=A0A1H2GWM3_9GAMM|nr:tryptophan 7-halogenase [Halopseudomonas salegens]SDU23994.1 Dehydrogenase (flavoprotein) [Halopseudomonas salegens]
MELKPDTQASTTEHVDVAIIGAGPSGAGAAAWLANQGITVKVIERQHFPRFSIGESLLPQCMEHLATCGLLEAATAGGYQSKNGAAFTWRGTETCIDFRNKFSPGPGTTWQVPRADFDQRLIQAAQDKGAMVEFGSLVEHFVADEKQPQLRIRREDDSCYQLVSRFVLDASGYGRILARQTGLACPSVLDPRCALFTHVADHIDCPKHDRNKILISLHPELSGVWYWLIPFSDGTASVGVVASRETLEAAGSEDRERLWHLIKAEPRLGSLLTRAEQIRDTGRLEGYSADVERLHGPGFAMLGNAGEFLDPVFSSGVTIALDSAVRAAPLVQRQLQGETIDWDLAFEQPLRRGVATFREFVLAWYDGRLPDIIFHQQQSPRIREMISSVLAGYAWDQENPFVAASARRLTSLAEACRQSPEQTISEQVL